MRASALGVVVAIGFVACSGSDSDSADTTSGSTPSTGAETTTPETTAPETTIPVAPTDPLIGIGDLTVVAEGLGFLEGPQWLADSGTLLFTEFLTTRGAPFAEQPGIIYELGADDELSVARASGPTANGLEVTEDGTLYATQPGERRVAVIGADGVETMPSGYSVIGGQTNFPQSYPIYNGNNNYPINQNRLCKIRSKTILRPKS